MELVNCTPNVITVAKSIDESADEVVRESVGMEKEGEGISRCLCGEG